MTELPDAPIGRQLGLLTSSTDPMLIDSVAEAGMDFLWLDAEYTGVTPTRASDAVHRLGGRGVSTLIRVPSIDPDCLVTYANVGVDEIVLPRVRSADEVERAWSALTYPPQGRRPRQVVPASAWGARFDRQPRISMIVETIGAVEALPKLLESGWLSGFWIGHKDLFDDYVREVGDEPGFGDYVEGVVDQFRAAGVTFGWGVSEPADVEAVWVTGATRCAIYWDMHLPRHLARSASARFVSAG